MFGLFGNKVFEPAITKEDKAWVENNLIWLIETFGLERLRAEPFILPTNDNFPYRDLTDAEQFKSLFHKLCDYWELNPQTITVTFFEDVKSKQWSDWSPVGAYNEAIGMYYQTGEMQFTIELAKSNLEDPQQLVATMAHELAHVKLLGDNYIVSEDPDMEPLTDLTTIYFGFGLFYANTCISNNNNWLSQSGYLPAVVISYANALLCYIIRTKAETYTPYLNTNSKELFEGHYQYLSRTDNTLLNPSHLPEYELVYLLNKQIDEGLINRNYSDVIEGCKILLEDDTNDTVAWNNLGYAYLQLKQYPEAVEAFDEAIEIDPYWDYPYNNRGYCLLQLGDLENAFTDLHRSFEMNPDNSFSWRNLGAYYLQLGQFDMALHHFVQAHKIDPETDMINFYLGTAHKMLGNSELSILYLEKSTALDEHSDSILV